MSALRTANEDMTSTSSVAMPEIPLGKVLKRKKDLEEETLVEKKVRYQTDFGKDRMGVTATAFAEYTRYVAKKFKIKIVKTPNPKSQNHLTFEAPEKDMKKFQQHLKKNLVKNAVDYFQKKNAGEPYNEQNMGESLEEGKAENKKAQIEKIKLMRKVKATTRGQKIALGDLLAMTSPKVLEGMFKRNPRGFMTMLQKMNPKRDKLTKADYIVDGQFVTSLGNLLTKDQTKELKENNKDKAFRDFRRAGGGRKRGVDPADQDMKATDDDRKAASKNIIMQLRRVSDLPRGGKVEFENGKTINVTKKDAVKIGQFFDRLRKPQDKAKFQAMIYKSPADMKKVLSKLR